MPKSTNSPMNVVPLERATEAKRRGPGRKPEPIMPNLPAEILEEMTPPEREHFEFFREAYEQAYAAKYGRLTPTARINILQASLDYVHLLRLQAEQMTSRTIVSQARQHPGTSLRAWLQAAGLQERDMEQTAKVDPQADAKAALLGLSRN